MLLVLVVVALVLLGAIVEAEISGRRERDRRDFNLQVRQEQAARAVLYDREARS